MPWTPLILIVVLVGVICGNSLLDNRLRQISTPYTAAGRNTAAQTAALLDEFNNEKDNTPTTIQERSPQPCYKFTDFKNDFLAAYYVLNACTKNSLDQQSNNDNENNKHAKDYFDFGSDVVKDEDAILKSNENREPIDKSTTLDENFYSDNDFISSIEVVDKRNPRDVELLEPDALPTIPSSNVNDFYEDFLPDSKASDSKRGGGVSTIGCDCKIKNVLLDLGQLHFPRYLLNAVCQPDPNSPEMPAVRCWRGVCKPLEYKVKILTLRTANDHAQKDPGRAWLPDNLRHDWKFKTVTVAAGCFCAVG